MRRIGRTTHAHAHTAFYSVFGLFELFGEYRKNGIETSHSRHMHTGAHGAAATPTTVTQHNNETRTHTHTVSKYAPHYNKSNSIWKSSNISSVVKRSSSQSHFSRSTKARQQRKHDRNHSIREKIHAQQHFREKPPSLTTPL